VTLTQNPAAHAEVKEIVLGLDTQLQNARRYGVRTTRRLHKAMLQAMLQDVRRAERRARAAEKRARQAERRAAAAEAELAAVRSSSTWKAGRVLVAVPARIKTGLIQKRRTS
jgi:hypothetical protein